jgi:hypothetical protein
MSRKEGKAQRDNPLRLPFFAAYLPTGRLCVNYFFAWMERANQSTQPQGAGGVSMGLVKSNRTENNVADPSLLKL